MPKLVRLDTAEELVLTTAGVVVGRERGCDILLRSKKVSRQHARVELRDNTPCVEDLGSSNGTKVNGALIAGVRELQVGDLVAFGDSVFQLIDDNLRPPLTRQDNLSSAAPLNKEVNHRQPSESEHFDPPPIKSESAGSEKHEAPLVASPGDIAKPLRKARRTFAADLPFEPTYSRATCVLLFLILLAMSFVFGRIATGLGAIELVGERSAREKMLTQDENRIGVTTTNVAGQPNSTAYSLVAPPPASSAESFSRQASLDGGPQQADHNGVNVDADLPSVESDGNGEMSVSESAKALKLMREATKMGIDKGDADALLKIAIEKLEIPADQAQRVVRFVKTLADRKAIMNGGIDAVFNLSQNPPSHPRPLKQSAGTTKSNSSPNATQIPAETSRHFLAPRTDTVSNSAQQQTAASSNSGTTVGKSQKRLIPQKNITAEIPARAVRLPPLRGQGYYLNVWGLTLVFGLLLAWLNSVEWMGRDLELYGFEAPALLRVSCIAGPAGTILAFCCPDLGWGVMLNSACLGAPLLSYIAVRDEHVPHQARLLQVLSRLKQGRERNAVEGQAAVAALPVEFLDDEATASKGVRNLASQLKNAPGIRRAKALIAHAFSRRASEIDLESSRTDVQSRFQVDGIARQDASFSLDRGCEMINIFMVAAAMDAKERCRPLNGRFRMKIGDEILAIRADLSQSAHGKRLTLKLLRNQEELSNLAAIGCNRRIQGELRKIVSQQQGLLLVCAPSDAGKLTTLRSAISELDSSAIKIMTVESPIEHQIAGVQQIDVDWKSGQTFASALRCAISQDPDVMMVGDIRDLGTAVAVCEAANAGHMVISAVHATGTLSAIQHLIDLGTDPDLLAGALSALLGQRLVRRLCPGCKVQYYPDNELLRRYRIVMDREIVFYRPAPHSSACPACEGTGYRGRTGVFELLKVDEDIRALIRRKATPAQLKAAARRRGLATLREDGFRLAIRGGTSLEEILDATKDLERVH